MEYGELNGDWEVRINVLFLFHSKVLQKVAKTALSVRYLIGKHLSSEAYPQSDAYPSALDFG